MNKRGRYYISWDLLRWYRPDITSMQACIIVILCLSVVMLGFRIMMLTMTHYLLDLEGALMFFRSLAYVFAWIGMIGFFYSYYRHKYDEQRDSFADTYRMKTTTLFASIASMLKFVATLAKLVLRTPENAISIIYLLGELSVWLAIFFFFLHYYKRMKHVYDKMLDDVGRIKL